MAVKLFAFTAEQITTIRNIARRVLYDELPAISGRGERRPVDGQTKEGILDNNLAVGGSATLSIYAKDQSNWADTGDDLTVEWPTGEGVAMDSGNYLRVIRINGAWRPATGVCP